MKTKILAGVVTALIYSGAAMAQDTDATQGQDTQQQSPDNIGGSGLDDNNIGLDQQDVPPVSPDMGMEDQGVGGGGDVGGSLGQDDALGGSGQVGQSGSQLQQSIPIQGPGGVTLYCTPLQGATGGSGTLQGAPLQGNEQSSLQRDLDVGVGEVDIQDDKAFGGSGLEEERTDMRGLTMMIGAGVEGYTGALAPELNPGPALGVTAALKPSKVFGLELGYSGAVNNIDREGVVGTGPDVVRNGVQANLTFGLAATPVQPYVLGGFGMNWYNVRNGQALGFRDDTNSKIPVGLGLRTHIGSFTADARVNYNVLLSEDFVPAGRTDDITTGSYNGMLHLGGTF